MVYLEARKRFIGYLVQIARKVIYLLPPRRPQPCRTRAFRSTPALNAQCQSSARRHSTARPRDAEVVGIFLNEDAIARLVGAILLEPNSERNVKRDRYITLETIAPSCATIPPPACPPWQADQLGPHRN
ncbi:hypothetical protein BRAO375_1270009 [Bradyrhizobium sp. ORS 375]|nr:hypothetical protein BRAO375_1270009 [Bradyrhizobium sp. ORS 375]